MFIIKKIKKYRSDQRVRKKFEKLSNNAKELLERNPQPELTENEIDEIDKYWAQYGIKYTDHSWFRFFYGVTGIKDPRFIPRDVYLKIIVPYYNEAKMESAWKDKNYFDIFLPDTKFPNTVLKNISGKFVDCNGEDVIGEDEIIKVLMSYKGKSVIVKNSWDTGAGKSVQKYKIEDEEDARRILKEWNHNNFIIQEVVNQHPTLAAFNETSVNIMRLTTWYHDGEVHILAPSVRVGTKGQITDVCTIDGVELVNTVGIKENGQFRDFIVDQHGIKIPSNMEDKFVPEWESVKKTVKNGHKHIKHFDIVGWDITVDEQNQVLCIEYNIARPGCIFYEYANGPFFGEYTDDALAFLKDKKNQEKYIPKWMRI